MPSRLLAPLAADHTAAQLGTIFKVSHEAMGFRLVNLGLR
jgi:hypothetical protein